MIKIPNDHKLKKTATLISKIKTEATIKLKKLRKRLKQKNKKINNNHHNTIPHQQPYSLRTRPPTTKALSHNSIASSSDQESSSSSSFSSQNCSTLSFQSTHQPTFQSPKLIHSQQLIPTLSLPYTMSPKNSHSSSDMLPTNEYPVATSRGINQLIYLDTQKQQQLNKAPVIPPLSPHPSSQYTNSSVHESDTSTMDPSLTFPIKEIQVHKPTL